MYESIANVVAMVRTRHLGLIPTVHMAPVAIVRAPLFGVPQVLLYGGSYRSARSVTLQSCSLVGKLQCLLIDMQGPAPWRIEPGPGLLWILCGSIRVPDPGVQSTGFEPAPSDLKDRRPDQLVYDCVPAPGFEPGNLLRVIEMLYQVELHGHWVRVGAHPGSQDVPPRSGGRI